MTRQVISLWKTNKGFWFWHILSTFLVHFWHIFGASFGNSVNLSMCLNYFLVQHNCSRIRDLFMSTMENIIPVSIALFPLIDKILDLRYFFFFVPKSRFACSTPMDNWKMVRCFCQKMSNLFQHSWEFCNMNLVLIMMLIDEFLVVLSLSCEKIFCKL